MGVRNSVARPESDGVFGIMANALATCVILFVIIGAFLEAGGAQRFFVDSPLAAVGRRFDGNRASSNRSRRSEAQPR